MDGLRDAQEAVDRIRAELAALMSISAPHGSLPAPTRFERGGPHKVGPEWHVPGGRLVRVIETDDERGWVYLEGSCYQMPGDIDGVTSGQARVLALALLAAADWADGVDELGQRRITGRSA